MKIVIGVGLLTLFALPLTALGQQTPAVGQNLARADFVGSQGQSLGSAALVGTPTGVLIQIRMQNVPEGQHGFHIHGTGKCDGPDFQSAGGHFNPTGAKHGFMPTGGAHAGDMPNVIVQSDGILNADIVLTGVTLGQGANSLLKEGGTALVMHAGPDDYATDPAGNSGGRIACAVIQRQAAAR
jgi:Cu-Zn family superoxide dismutase